MSADVWKKYLCHVYPSLSKVNSENVTSVNGCLLNILGKTFMQFTIGTEAFHFEAHVIEDLTYDVIIGRGILLYFRSRIDFENGVLTFSREENSLPFCDVETDFLSDDVEDDNSDFICSVHADFSFTIALFTVTFSHLHYNVFEHGCEAISGNFALLARNCLTSTFKNIVMQMRKVNCEKGYST